MKTTIAPTVSAATLVDFVRAEAGNSEARFDARFNAIYRAARGAMLSGQRTPFLTLAAQCAMYATPKACRALTDTPDRASSAATKAHAVFAAYGSALNAMSAPVRVKGEGDAHLAAIEGQATMYAGEFAALVTQALAPAPVDTKAQAEAKAKREADKASKAAAAEQAAASAVREQAQVLAQASVMTLADMVRVVANALVTGMLDVEQVIALDHALDACPLTASVDIVVSDVEHIDALPAPI